jgi:hypothetical protein
MSRAPELIEAYRGWSPEVDVRGSVTRLMSDVPPRYTAGLRSIVLTNAAALSHDDRRRKVRARGKRALAADAGGLYHQSCEGQPAWIELFVDNLFRDVPRWMLRLRLVRDGLVAEALFHELGHYIHEAQAPEFREPENVADDWERRFSRAYFRRRYPFLRPLGVLFRPALRAFRAVFRPPPDSPFGQYINEQLRARPSRRAP